MTRQNWQEHKNIPFISYFYIKKIKKKRIKIIFYLEKKKKKKKGAKTTVKKEIICRYKNKKMKMKK